MTTVPMFLYLSLRYNSASNNIFSDTDATFVEESHIIPVYDCYYADAPQEKRGDEYCHYYIRNFVKKDANKGKSDFFDMIDPKLKVCCRNGELFYADSNSSFFRHLDGILQLRNCDPNSPSFNKIIGTLEETNITM